MARDFSGATIQLNKMLEDFASDVRESTNVQLNKGAQYLVQAEINATPYKTGVTKSSWVAVTKYNGVKYIFNTALSPSRIPVLNLLEFAHGQKPFARKVFKSSESYIASLMDSVGADEKN